MNTGAFAAQRREQLEVGDERLGPVVAAAMADVGADGWDEPILDAAGRIYVENYVAEAPDAAYRAPLLRFRSQLAAALEKTTENSNAERITRWISTYAVNAGTIQGAYRRGVRYKVWHDMQDEAVRESHRHASGQVVPIGGAFTVAGVKVGYPGEPVGPFEIWINCRCVAQPAARSGETMSDNTLDLGSNAHTRSIIAAADAEEPRTGALVVMLPAADDPIAAATSEDMAHMTTIWFGDINEMPVDIEELEQAVRLYAEDLVGPIVVPVKERGQLGDDGADVVFLEPTDSLLAARDGMFANEPIKQAYDAAEQFPNWTPHVTLGYPEGVENGPAVGEYDGTEVTFDRLGLWLGGDYTEYPMGGVVSDTITADASSNPVDDQSDLTESEEVGPADDDLEEDEELITEIPVHGVLAPEGVETGDGRGFRDGAISSRPLPYPLRLEVMGTHGGNTSDVVTVGRIDEAWRDEATKMWRFRGVVIVAKGHANEAIDGIIDGSGTGVSIDADAMAVDMEGFSDDAMAAAEAAGKNPTTWFSETRVAGLTIVPIPAFHEAYIALGHEFEEDMSEESLAASAAALADCGCGEAIVPPELPVLAQGGIIPGGRKVLVGGDGPPEYIVPLSRTADNRELLEKIARGESTFAPGTKDGPGWITNPVGTSRLRRYWTKGEGAAKIGWGRDGDFGRCRRLLAEYVQNPEWLAGLCANMHKEATGMWPGDRRNRARMGLIASGALAAPVLQLVKVEEEPDAITAAAAFPGGYPSEWFADPKFRTVTPMTIDKANGRIYGHLAQWGVCHIGVAGDCVKPPHSRSGYANFLKGVVDTTAGEQQVGCFTYGIGHANPRWRVSAATAHYDQIEAIVAYVNVGEDSFGIWYSGVLRPGVDEDLVDEFRAVGAVSGDWRPIGRFGLDLIASVAVNTPGFPVSIAASGGEVTALIAAGMVTQADREPESTPDSFADDNADFLATAIAKAMDKRENQKREQALRQRAHSIRQAEVRRRINERQ